jgi:iron complex transport system substrate-binding protein
MGIIDDNNLNDNYFYLNSMLSHDAYRRSLLKGMLLSPWWFYATKTQAALPIDLTRIIALEWRPVELLAALELTPLAIADVPNYRSWVADPPLAPAVMDVGLRDEPNREAIQRLRPSLLLLSSGYGPTPQSFASIAPAMAFQFSNAKGLPLTAAYRDVRLLGDRLDLGDRARRHLLALDQQIAMTGVRLRQRDDRPLLLFSFIDSRHIMVIGQHSLFQEVMDRLGLVNAWQGEVNPWGSTVVGIERLAELPDVQALCFHRGEQDPLNDAIRSPLWQVLPFVRERRWRIVPAVWFFGATIAALRFCHLLEHSLEPRV